MNGRSMRSSSGGSVRPSSRVVRSRSGFRPTSFSSEGETMNALVSGGLTRRSFLSATGVAMIGWAWQSQAEALALLGAAVKEVTIVEFSDAGVRGEKVRVSKIVKTDAEWKQELSADS